MRSIKRIVAATLTSFILLSTTIVANAETSQNIIQNSERKLEQNSELINQKETEQKTILTEITDVQSDLLEIENEMSKNKEEIVSIEKKMDETQKLIEEKKEEIVLLEDKVLARKGIMEERLVSIHNNDQASLIIEIIVDSENFNDLVQRVTAVSTVMNADKDLLEQQQLDLQQIENEKIEIDNQEQILKEQNNLLASNQANLEQNLQKRQELFDAAQQKYNTISNEISIAEKDKQVIQEQLNQAQANLKSEQEAAAARVTANAEKVAEAEAEATANAEKAAQQPVVVDQPSAPKNDSDTNSNTNSNKKTVQEVSKSNESASSNKELYVSATAYSHESSTTGLTATGYNIKSNPNIKLIAVDPSVIPLGTKVWVEGYGEAIAGDTGGAIKGHKIDVLMPSSAQARSWGRKTVKITILN
jgi:3D (Asp-Asp-Asp) domain-containing protein/peptidoglycan hydrolase CwlO-like protein